MNTSFEKKALSSTFANMLLFTSHFFQSIIVVPFLLQYWGKEKYGVWLGIYAFFTLIQIFDIGHQTYVGNKFNQFFHIDKHRAQKILGSGVIASIFIGAAELLLTFVIVLAGLATEVVGMPKNFVEPTAIWGLVALVIMWFLAGSIGGLLVRMILPLGMLARFIYISLIIRVATIGILMAGAFLQWSLFTVCLSYAIAYFTYSYALFYYIYKLMPEFFPWWKGASAKTAWKNFRNSLAVTFNNTLEQFSTNGLIIIISNFMGAAAIPMFTTLRTVANTALQGTGMVLNPLYPEMIRFHAHKEAYKLQQTLLTNWLITGFLVNTGFLLLILFVEPLYHWWTKGELEFNMGLFMLLVGAVAVANYNRGIIIYLTGINHLRAMAYISSTRFIFTAAISLIGIHFWGLYALGLSLVFAEIGCTFWAVLYFKRSLQAMHGNYATGPYLLSAAIPVIILGLIYTMFYIHPQYALWLIIFGISGILPFYMRIYSGISPEVKLRFQKLLLNKAR